MYSCTARQISGCLSSLKVGLSREEIDFLSVAERFPNGSRIPCHPKSRDSLINYGETLTWTLLPSKSMSKTELVFLMECTNSQAHRNYAPHGLNLKYLSMFVVLNSFLVVGSLCNSKKLYCRDVSQDLPTLLIWKVGVQEPCSYSYHISA